MSSLFFLSVTDQSDWICTDSPMALVHLFTPHINEMRILQDSMKLQSCTFWRLMHFMKLCSFLGEIDGHLQYVWCLAAECTPPPAPFLGVHHPAGWSGHADLGLPDIAPPRGPQHQRRCARDDQEEIDAPFLSRIVNVAGKGKVLLNQIQVRLIALSSDHTVLVNSKCDDDDVQRPWQDRSSHWQGCAGVSPPAL